MKTQAPTRMKIIAGCLILTAAVTMIVTGETRTYFTSVLLESGECVKYYIRTDDAQPNQCQIATVREGGVIDVWSSAEPPVDPMSLELISTGDDLGDFPMPYLVPVVLGDPGNNEGKM